MGEAVRLVIMDMRTKSKSKMASALSPIRPQKSRTMESKRCVTGTATSQPRSALHWAVKNACRTEDFVAEFGTAWAASGSSKNREGVVCSFWRGYFKHITVKRTRCQ